MNSEDYPFPEEENPEDKFEINLNCRCPELTCKRHGNCKECQKFHNSKCQLTYCGK